MMVKDGDESHGIRIPKKSPKKTTPPKSYPSKDGGTGPPAGSRKFAGGFARETCVDQQQQT